MTAVSAPDWLDMGCRQVAGEAVLLGWARTRIDPDLELFRGHFPGAPLLPGIVQINWGLTLAAQLFPVTAALSKFRGLARVKFTRPLFPGQQIEYRLHCQAGRIDLEVHRSDALHTKGRLLYLG